MLLFNVVTNIKPAHDDLEDFISKATPRIGEKIKMDIGLVIHFSQKMEENECDRTSCQITRFEEELGDTDLQETARLVENLLNEWMSVEKHEFVISVSHYKNKVLVDWTQNTLIASMPVHDQRKTSTCWAFTAADVISCNYISMHPMVKTIEESVCSPEELIEWVYSTTKLNKKKDFTLDENRSTYSSGPQYPLYYARRYGISLLQNYEIIRPQKRKFRAMKDGFEDMRMSKGPRIYIKDYKVHNFNPDGSPFSIQLVTKVLSEGVVHGSIRFCHGCETPGCQGFFNFVGDGIYDEPDHGANTGSANAKSGSHAVTILRVGNREGIDYVHVRNSAGLKWGNGGYGDVHIKLLRRFFRVMGTEKKDIKEE